MWRGREIRVWPSPIATPQGGEARRPAPLRGRRREGRPRRGRRHGGGRCGGPLRAGDVRWLVGAIDAVTRDLRLGGAGTSCVRKETTREGDAGGGTPARRTPGWRGRRLGRGCWRIGRGRRKCWPGRGTGRRGRHLRRGHMRAVPQRGDRRRRRATQAREIPAVETFTQGCRWRGRRPRRGLWRAVRPRGDMRKYGGSTMCVM